MKINYHILFFVLTLANTLFAVTHNKTKEQKEAKNHPCNLSSLGGEHPKMICETRDFLLRFQESIKKEKSKQEEPSEHKNVNEGNSEKNNTPKSHEIPERLSILERISNNILIWGKPGTGKSTAAQSFARDSGIKPQVYTARSIDQKGKEKGAAFIKHIYRNAIKDAANSSKPIIIIIDEIDDLYNPKKRTGNEQYILAELMNQLQNCLGNPKVITIFTANSYELIEEKFTSRCHVIHWQAPNWQQRYDIIKYYTCIYPHTISDKDVETFASYTIGFVGRDIELAFENAFRIASSKNKNTFNTEILFEAFAAIRNKIDQRAPQSFISKILFLRRIQATFGY